MRLRVLSDLHVEEAAFEPPPAGADVVVLAGDIHNGAQSLRWAREAFPDARIVQIAGNHEFYDGEYHEVLAGMRHAARETGIDFLENDVVVIDGVRFLGCTLWTDFRVFEGREPVCEREQAMALNARRIPDFRVIQYRNADTVATFTPHDSVRIHEASKQWLDATLATPFEGPTVVVTHHLPSWQSVTPAFARWVTNAAFVSELDSIVARADLWIHGHTHSSMQYRLGGTQVVCNPRGYPVSALRRMGLRATKAASTETTPAATAALDEASDPAAQPEPFENQAFDPGLVIEIPAR